MATDFESFRGQLISTLKAKGTLDTLKTQLRTELVNEIRLKGKLSSASPASATIEARALDSLVLSHLRAMRYEYASSVLVPEARLSDHVMSDADACRVFRTELNRVKPDGAPGSTLLQLLIAGATQRPAALLESSTQTEASDGATMELMLEQVDRKMQSHLASGDGMWPLHALEDHMLKYQKEADARCESKLQAEIIHLREVELHKIRAEERVSAKAEIERVLGEQKHYYAAQQNSLRTREARAVEAMRKREADFEASCYEHRQKMLMEIEALRTREKQHLAEMEARQRELTAAERRLEAQRALDQQQAASVARSREIELERANDELVRAARDHQQEKKHAMLEIGRQQQALADERASVQAERERDAAAVARAVLTREELAETKDKLRETETALARTASELHAMQAKVPVLQEERVQLLTRISERDAALKMSQDRCASLTEELAAVEKRMSVQGTSGLPYDQAASIDHGVAFARLQAEHQSELRKAREQTRVALEEQRAHFEKMLRDAANEHGELSQVVREQAAQIHSLRTYSCSETYTGQASHVAESRSDGAAHSSAYASAPAACADLHHSKSTSAPAERASRSCAAGGTHHSLPPYAPPNVAIAAAASEAASHGLDREFRGEPEPDPFVASFEQSKAKLRDLDHKNAELQKVCRRFLSSSGCVSVRPSHTLCATAEQLWSATSTEQGEVRELPKLQPLPWHHPSANRWAMTRSEAEKAAAPQDSRHIPEASEKSNTFQASDRSKLQEAHYTTKSEAFGLRSQPMAVGEHIAAGVSRQEARTAFGHAEIAWETESAGLRKEAESVMEAVEASREDEAARSSREAEAEPGAARKARETGAAREAGAEAARKAGETMAAREAQEAEAAREAEAEAARKARQAELAREADAEAARKAREAKAEAEAARKALDAEVAFKAEAEASMQALEAEAEAARKARDAGAALKAKADAEASEKAREAEAEAARRARQEEAARKAEAEAEASRKAREAEAEAARKAREEVAAREAEARADASRKAREAEAEAARKAREEEAARQAATEAEASRRAREAEAEAARKSREEEAARAAATEAEASRKAREAEAEAARKAREEVAAREAEARADASRKAREAEAEAARKAREEEAARQAATEAEASRRAREAEAEAARKSREEEAARAAATEAEASRKAREAEAEAARKARELSALKQREQADAERNANAAKAAEAARAAEEAREAELERKRALFAAEAAEEEAQRQRERDEEMKRLLATQQQEQRRDERAREEAAREKKEREERLRAQQEKMRLRKEEEQERKAAEAAQREKEERERQAAEDRRLAAMATSKLFEKSVAQATDIDVFGLEGETDASNSLGESMDDDASGNMW